MNLTYDDLDLRAQQSYLAFRAKVRRPNQAVRFAGWGATATSAVLTGGFSLIWSVPARTAAYLFRESKVDDLVQFLREQMRLHGATGIGTSPYDFPKLPVQVAARFMAERDNGETTSKDDAVIEELKSPKCGAPMCLCSSSAIQKTYFCSQSECDGVVQVLRTDSAMKVASAAGATAAVVTAVHATLDQPAGDPSVASAVANWTVSQGDLAQAFTDNLSGFGDVLSTAADLLVS